MTQVKYGVPPWSLYNCCEMRSASSAGSLVALVIIRNIVRIDARTSAAGTPFPDTSPTSTSRRSGVGPDEIVQVAADPSGLFESCGPPNTFCVRRNWWQQFALNVRCKRELGLDHDVFTLEA